MTRDDVLKLLCLQLVTTAENIKKILDEAETPPPTFPDPVYTPEQLQALDYEYNLKHQLAADEAEFNRFLENHF